MPAVHHAVTREIDAPSKAKLVYLAHGYSFSERRVQTLLQPIVDALESLGLDVVPPRDQADQTAVPRPGWAYQIGQEAFTHITLADGFLAVVDGSPPDEGAMVDLGMAIALGKPTFLLQDDSRRVLGDEPYPMNLKLFVGMPQEDWRDYYYTSVEEITAPGKAIARWAHR